MKTLKIAAIAAVSSLVVACGGPEGQKATTEAAQEVVSVAGDVYQLDSNSTIAWTGTKMAGDHTGTIAIIEGDLKVVGNDIVGGTIVIDMNSIINEDLEGEWKDKLVGHLKSADFFDVATYPTATFEITEVIPTEGNPEANMSITGNLTMKDTTNSITFDALVNVGNGEAKIAAPNFILDRTSWNVKYGSAKIFGIIKDKAISDDMALSFNVTAKM